MTDALRAFIAVPMPDAVTAFLANMQARLRPMRLDIRWVPCRNVHLTLKFLGDVNASQVPGIAARMDAAASDVQPFELTAGGVGVFPHRRNARVIWVGVSGEVDRLHRLQAALESELTRDGFPREARAYRGHLTIGRIRRRVPASALNDALASVTDAMDDAFRVEAVALYRSLLKPSGAEYQRLHTSTLAG